MRSMRKCFCMPKIKIFWPPNFLNHLNIWNENCLHHIYLEYNLNVQIKLEYNLNVQIKLEYNLNVQIKFDWGTQHIIEFFLTQTKKKFPWNYDFPRSQNTYLLEFERRFLVVLKILSYHYSPMGTYMIYCKENNVSF
jgi:hypothetical protein